MKIEKNSDLRRVTVRRGDEGSNITNSKNV
jgi:hypothetical protein